MVFLRWCGGVFVVVVWWCQHPARELVLFGVLPDCGGVVKGPQAKEWQECLWQA